MQIRKFATGLVSLTSIILVAFACQKSDAISSITVSPGEDLADLAYSAPEGMTIYLKPGVYRMQMIRPRDGQTFIGQDGAILSGAMVLTDWDQEDGLWVVDGLPDPLHRSGYCDEGYELCTYREDMFVDGVLYRRVDDKSKLGPGLWYGGDNKAYIQINPEGRLIELGVTPAAFTGKAQNVTIKNIIVEKYASEAQQGAIQGTQSTGWQVIDVTARWNHGGGLSPGKSMIVQGGSYSYNGQIGMVGEGDGAVIENTEISFNNYANYNWGWEAGGTKFWRTDGMTIRNNCVHNNYGPGLWTDIDNINILYENNVVFANDGDGIKHEISYKATIRNNFVGLNGKGKDNWLWGSQILVQNSSDVEVYENVVEVPISFGNGIGLIHQKRGDGAHGPWVTTNVKVHDNLIVYLANRGGTGLVTDFDHEVFEKDLSNKFDRNTYVLTNRDQRFWRDNDGDATMYNLGDSPMEKEGKIVIETRKGKVVQCDVK